MADLRDHLTAIRAEHGVLTAPVVVGVARDPGHPLHDRFEWDDTIAGERFREHQARELIRSVRIKYTDDQGGASDLRGFVSVSRGDVPAREYVPVDEVATDPVLAALALRDAEREWRELLARYQHLEAFIAIVRRDLGEAAA